MVTVFAKCVSAFGASLALQDVSNKLQWVQFDLHETPDLCQTELTKVGCR